MEMHKVTSAEQGNGIPDALPGHPSTEASLPSEQPEILFSMLTLVVQVWGIITPAHKQHSLQTTQKRIVSHATLGLQPDLAIKGVNSGFSLFWKYQTAR
eukprot:1629192-Amphidinium_carterae.1